MTDLPDRRDRGRLRVSDTDRERVAEILREAAGEGRLSFEELDQRLERAYGAKTYADLDDVTEDLPAGRSGAAAEPIQRRFPVERIGGTPTAKLSVAIMSGAQRKGQWVVPSMYTAVAIMGGIELDLRQATFSEPAVTIQAYALMGGVSITAPTDIEIDVSGIGFMGGFDDRASGPGVPGAPRLKVIGFAMMGGVDVQRKAMKPKRKPQIETDQRPGIEG